MSPTLPLVRLHYHNRKTISISNIKPLSQYHRISSDIILSALPTMTGFFKTIWLYFLASGISESTKEAKPTRFLRLSGQSQEGFIPERLPSHFISVKQAKNWTYEITLIAVNVKETKVRKSWGMFYSKSSISQAPCFYHSSEAFYVIAQALKQRCHAAKKHYSSHTCWQWPKMHLHCQLLIA